MKQLKGIAVALVLFGLIFLASEIFEKAESSFDNSRAVITALTEFGGSDFAVDAKSIIECSEISESLEGAFYIHSAKVEKNELRLKCYCDQDEITLVTKDADVSSFTVQ